MVCLSGDALLRSTEGTESTEGHDPLKQSAPAVKPISRWAATKARAKARKLSATQGAPTVPPLSSTELRTAVKSAVKHVPLTQSSPAVSSISTPKPKAAAVVTVLSKSAKRRMNKWTKKQEELKNAVPL